MHTVVTYYNILGGTHALVIQLELTLLRIESRLKDAHYQGEELDVDRMSFMVDVDEIEDNSSVTQLAKRRQQ
jgi:hypothetical protein